MSKFALLLKGLPLFFVLISEVSPWLIAHTPKLNVGSLKSSVADISAPTKVSFTLPRFYEGEVEHGDYPSPLHSIHVRSILSDEEASRCLEIATKFAEATGAFDQPDQDRHATYATCDFPLESCKEITAYLRDIDLDGRIWEDLSDLYGVEQEDMTYLDNFCAHYRTRSDDRPNVMDRLEPHRDGSILSYTITLTNPDEFEGGGTFYDALRDMEPSPDGILCKGGVVRPKRAGDVVYQSGKVLHGADVVLAGTRTVLVGFVDVAFWSQRPGVLSKACADWGRMDVAKLRLERQKSKTQGGKNGWFLNNERWIAAGDVGEERGRSYIRGFCPAFTSVERRGNEEFQRLKKLQAEDVLLRSILLDENDKSEILDLFGGDVSIV